MLISAAITPSGGAAARLTDLILAGGLDVEMIACPALIDEVRDVLGRPKFARYVDARLVETFVTALREAAVLVGDPVVDEPLTRDPKDDYLVALARSAQTHAIVSGDRDLLDLHQPSPPIITARAFLDRLGA